MDDETGELRNPFPSPPNYTRYTSHNLRLLALLKERAPLDEKPNQHQVLSDQKDVPEWDLIQLEKPRVDWILEEPEPHYSVYGQQWFVKDPEATLADAGGVQLYSSDPAVDRRPALQTVLKSLLVTYSGLISSLAESHPPPEPPNPLAPELSRLVEWIKILTQNLLAAANDLRPMQARCNLELMMQRQIELRREETRNIHSKCDALEAKLRELRTSPLQSSLDALKAAIPIHPNGHNQQRNCTPTEVLEWAEETV